MKKIFDCVIAAAGHPAKRIEVYATDNSQATTRARERARAEFGKDARISMAIPSHGREPHKPR